MAPAAPPPAPFGAWARDTWRSIEALIVPATGLPADAIDAQLDPASRTHHTSPANIGALLWSVVAAHELRLVDRPHAEAICARTLRTLDALDGHAPSGMLFNWYDARSGAISPASRRRGRSIQPFVSSADNGWLAAALIVVASALPRLRAAAERRLDRMDFRVFYDPGARPQGGLLRGGFWAKRPRVETVLSASLPGAAAVHATPHHYDLLASEPRIATYVAIARGQLPAAAYDALDALPRHYRGRTVLASLGGAMFEVLSPELFVPEAAWAPATWGRNHADTASLHREHGLDALGYPSWGFSPCACPGGGYAEFGVPALAWLADGYRTQWRGQGVVTPHASALALDHDPDGARENLAVLERELGCYGRGGFHDSVGVRTRLTAGRHLMLDQAFVLGAIANHVSGGAALREHFAGGAAAALRPLVATRAWPAMTDGGQ